MLAGIAWVLLLTGVAAGGWFIFMKDRAIREMSPAGRKRAQSIVWQWELLNRSNYVSETGYQVRRKLLFAALYQLIAWGSALIIFWAES